MGKATNFKFCTHILSIDRNKSPLQISGKVAGCIVRILKTFQCTHMLGASRGLLCDSSAVLSCSKLMTENRTAKNAKKKAKRLTEKQRDNTFNENISYENNDMFGLSRRKFCRYRSCESESTTNFLFSPSFDLK